MLSTTYVQSFNVGSTSCADLLMRLLGLTLAGGSGDSDGDPRVRQLFLSIQRRDSGTMRRMIETDRGLLTAVCKDFTPLGYASYIGGIGLMDTLLELGADLELRDPKGRTPLLNATEGKEPEAAFHLIDKGANVNASNKKQQTALHFAAIRDMPAVIQRLLLCGADINAEACLELILELEDRPHVEDRLNGEFTALHIAANNDHVECVGLLILLGGAIVDHGDGRRQLTPLHLACRNGQFMSAKCLLEMGANVNAIDIYGITPLHLAMGKVPKQDQGSEGLDKDLTSDERIRIACLLIDNGAVIDVCDYSGRTPMHFAQTDVQRAIQQYIDGQSNAVKGCVSSDVAPTLAVTSDPCPSSRTVVTGDSEDSGAADLTSPISG
ncbi:ankyrin-1-like [Pomacea canaliculata]|uniref:ankyrin-1-like n=1 Tax=Pomacea canaliculata TaxID=400727 RepID=UPI000D738897|nr:ankyrin-1-like [Pomacea canaliculata]